MLVTILKIKTSIKYILMNIKKITSSMINIILLIIINLSALSSLFASVSPQIIAISENKVMLQDDGRIVVLKLNELTSDGYKLVAADGKSAVFERDGLRYTLNLANSGRLEVGGNKTVIKEIDIKISEHGEYLTKGKINNKPIDVIVDTGANIMAISSVAARALGIEYKKGKPATIETAGGSKDGYIIVLDSVTLGPITMHKVDAAVIEGEWPKVALVGMSFLKHLKMQAGDNVLKLMLD